MNISRISQRFGVPYRTLFRWKEGGWRREILEYISEMDSLEEEAEKKIRTLFKENEIKALISSFSGVAQIDADILEEQIEEIYLYQPTILIKYKPNNIELEALKNALISKIRKLCNFERYVLSNIIGRDRQRDQATNA